MILKVFATLIIGGLITYFNYPVFDKLPKFSIKTLSYMLSVDTNKSPYDTYSYLFAQQWPISACITEVLQKSRGVPRTSKDCKFPERTESWTIHGIWPGRIGGSFPAFCGGKELYESDIRNITSEMNYRWPTIRNYDANIRFWQYQWRKHGTCLKHVPSLSTPYLYFKQALDWNQHYDIAAAFKHCKLPPNDIMKYSSFQLLGCLKKYFNITSQINLHYGYDNTYRSDRILSEVRICFDENFIPTDCYAGSDGNVFYPSTVENKPSSSILSRFFFG